MICDNFIEQQFEVIQLINLIIVVVIFHICFQWLLGVPTARPRRGQHPVAQQSLAAAGAGPGNDLWFLGDQHRWGPET